MPLSFFLQPCRLLAQLLDFFLLRRGALPKCCKLGSLIRLGFGQQAAFPFSVRDLLIGRLSILLRVQQGNLQVIDRDLEILDLLGLDGLHDAGDAKAAQLLHLLDSLCIEGPFPGTEGSMVAGCVDLVQMPLHVLGHSLYTDTEMPCHFLHCCHREPPLSPCHYYIYVYF